jgi:predicted ATPase/DNA-binding winged helix-turn-helix (wHTH) protein
VDQPQAWQFGPFSLLPAQRLLLDGEAPVRVGGRALDILIALVERAGQVIDRDELIASVWTKVIVYEGSLRVHIAALRQALGDDGEGRRYIVNIPGRGYSFVGDAKPRAPSSTARTDRVVGLKPRRLPPLLVSVIGRDDAIDEVVANVAEQRLVTVVGTGGIGKTTVALAAANQLAARYRDGAIFIDLAPLTDPRRVAVQVAHAVTDAPLVSGAHDLEELLADRQMLIVLDNCEHVVEAATTVAEIILAAAPGVRLLATSREPLRAAGECVVRLSTLEMPPASAKLSARQALGFSAIELFTKRTAATLGAFALTDEDVPLVIEISRHLDGIPLAIELAAGRVAQLGLRGLLAALQDRFAVLTKGRRTALPRQQTLRAAIDWSYDLLSEDEKAVLRRLSIFAGAFTFDSAVAVCEDNSSADACDAMDGLLLKSLISFDTANNVPRYRLLEVTRAYALEKLKEAGELLAVSRSHAEHVCSIFERLEAESPLDLADEDAYHAHLIDDIQLAVQASFTILRDTSLGIRLLATTASVWYQRSLLDEYRKRAEEALERAAELPEQPAPTLMHLWHSLGHCYWHTKGPHPDVARAFGETFELARKLENVDFERRALWGLWAERAGSGAYAAALDLARKHAALLPLGTEPEVEIRSRLIVQLSLHLMGNQASSQEEAMTALRLIGRTDDQRTLGQFQLDPRAETNTVLARALWIRGFPGQALEVAAEAVRSARSTQHALTLCYALFGQCGVLLWCGRWADLGRQAEELIEVSTAKRLGLWRSWGQTFKDAWTYGTEGVIAPQWRDALRIPHQLEIMATGSEELLVNEVVDRAQAGQCPWCAPEVLRAHGEKLLRQGASPQEGEHWFERSLELARSSGALSWELRAATSLARCWSSQNRRDEAKELLAGVLGRCTEGLDTLDVRRARLLQQG